jgi:hypothetical protein
MTWCPFVPTSTRRLPRRCTPRNDMVSLCTYEHAEIGSLLRAQARSLLSRCTPRNDIHIKKVTLP